MVNSNRQLDSNGQFDGLDNLAQFLDTGNVYVEQRDRQGNWQTLFRLHYKKKRDKNAISTDNEQLASLPKLAGTPL